MMMKGRQTMKLQNKTAIVTGGGSGIGRATAMRMAAEGANVVIIDINENTAAQAVDENQPGRAVSP